MWSCNCKVINYFPCFVFLAVQIQQAYAYKMNVNFIGAGANNISLGNAGIQERQLFHV